MDDQRISREKMIALIIDSKYSIDAQIAILRQKDEKPEDYAAFFAFAEEVKRKVTEEYEKYAAEDAVTDGEEDYDDDEDEEYVDEFSEDGEEDEDI